MKGPQFIDAFSDTAERYAEHRPTYPKSLFSTLASLSPATELHGTAVPATARPPSDSPKSSVPSLLLTRVPSKSLTHSLIRACSIAQCRRKPLVWPTTLWISFPWPKLCTGLIETGSSLRSGGSLDLARSSQSTAIAGFISRRFWMS
jgi:hypothetical protein